MRRHRECCVEVGEEVVGLFEPNGEPQVAEAPELGRPPRRARAVRPDVHDQGLVVADGHGGGDDAQLGDEAVLQIGVAVQGEGHDRPVAQAVEQPPGQRVLGVGREPRVRDVRDRRMRGEELRDPLC